LEKKFKAMIVWFGILWFFIAILIVLFIQGKIGNRHLFYRMGFTLIMLSFIGGVVLLAAAIMLL
jgi:hypothetical protein